MSKSNPRSKRKRLTTQLKGHRRQKKTLQPPLVAAVGNKLKPIRGNRDILPELLWIDAVLYEHDWRLGVAVLHKVLDILDEYLPPSAKVVDGTISSLEVTDIGLRAQIVKRLQDEDLYDMAFPESFRHALSLYYDCPARWLIAGWQQETHADPERGIAYLKRAVLRLYDTRTQYPTRCRMIRLMRLVVHGKLHIQKDLEIARLLPKYPSGLTDEEQAITEASVRAMDIATQDLFETDESWPKYFWRHNFEISGCLVARDDRQLPSYEAVYKTLEQLQGAVDELGGLINNLVVQVHIDLYEPDKEDVLFGLISRQYRLFSELTLNPGLWKPEFGKMIHRLMVDTQILIRWLLHRNTPELYRRFKEYSIGKQKLQLLHVEELIDIGKLSDDYEKIVEALRLGVNEEVFEEYLIIDFGSLFPNMDERKMAEEVGLKDQYDIVYQPNSAVVHGEWMSLKDFYLTQCLNPLHRFHWLPNIWYSSQLRLEMVATGVDLLLDSIRSWVSCYGIFWPTEEIERIRDSISTAIGNL